MSEQPQVRTLSCSDRSYKRTRRPENRTNISLVSFPTTFEQSLSGGGQNRFLGGWSSTGLSLPEHTVSGLWGPQGSGARCDPVLLLPVSFLCRLLIQQKCKLGVFQGTDPNSVLSNELSGTTEPGPGSAAALPAGLLSLFVSGSGALPWKPVFNSR